MDRKIMPTMVQADIQPYKAIAIDKETGKIPVINSRKDHREFLHKNGYIELGDDFTPPKGRDEGHADAPMVSVDELKKRGFVEESF